MVGMPSPEMSSAGASFHGSAEALARLRRRRRSDVRLQAYGKLAIVVALAALASLAWSVVSKTTTALSEHYIRLEFPLPANSIDPEGTGDVAVIGKADFGGITKTVLRNRFPGVKGRKARRQLNDIVSNGASFELRQHVLDNPDLLSTPNRTITFDFLVSDIGDLYYKGHYGGFDATPVGTEAVLTVAASGEGEWLVTSETPVFRAAIGDVHAVLIDQAQRLRRQAALQENGRRVFEAQIQDAESADRRKELRDIADERAAQRDRLSTEADGLVALTRPGGGLIPLNKDMPSLVIRAGRTGWYRLAEVEADRAVVTTLSGPSELPGRLEAGEWSFRVNATPESRRKVSDLQAVWFEDLRESGAVRQVANWRFFTSGDSREPELAGILGAAVGSFWTMVVTFVLAFPIGVLAAVYLEEFAPRNRWTDLIEVNINNLAAVPSIVFGLLGLAIFLGFFGVPRSAPLAGGIALALMTLPTIIIASRAAIAAVPPSIRDAALGVGASRLQTTFHHVLPLALPGVLTGTIIGMAQALGETAPLIMIGMVAFVVDVPGGVTDSATALPVQVFRWADLPERAFEARTAAAICVLLVFLVVMNALAVFLRRRFERRW